MKKYLKFSYLILISIILQGMFVKELLCAPTNSMSISPSATDATTITASDENSRNNEVSTKFNAHDHNDIDQTANTLNVGDATAGDKTVTAYNADANKPYLKYDDTNNYWVFSEDGVMPSVAIHGNAVIFEGSTDDAYETTLSITDPTADRTQTFQNNSGVLPLGTAGNTIFFTTTGATNVTIPTSGTLSTSTGPQVSHVDGATSGPTTTSTSYVDLTDITVTITTGANPVLILFSGDFASTSAGGNIYVIIEIDGVDQADSERTISIDNVNYQYSVATTWLTTATAGSHTFKIQWKVSGGTGTATGTSRAMEVLEFK